MAKFEIEKVGIEKLAGFKSKPGVEVIDNYEHQLEELFLIRNPKFRFVPDHKKEQDEFSAGELAGKPIDQQGNWFYFPWSNVLLHLLPEPEFFEVRTARNKNLISAEEQQKYYNFAVAIAGLSVGSHAALTLVMSGGAKNIKIADPDTISNSNLNRIRYGATKIGSHKAHLAAQQIAEMNPYANIYVYDQGVTPENIGGFLGGADGSPKADIFVEEMDNLPMKIMLRMAAKEMHLPVIMATDNGDGIIVDVERYDLDPNTIIFNGAIGDLKMEDFAKFTPADMPKLATKVAGPEYVVPKMLGSLMEVGKTLYSWPQLGTAATICGSAISFLVRLIANGKKIASKKYNLSLDDIFEVESSEEKQQSEQQRKEYLKVFGL